MENRLAMTERLYWMDSHRREFEATVISCLEEKGRWAVILDKTAFFPEGGGQSADTGLLGGVKVEDARERGDEVVHYCAAPLTVGSLVRGEIDWAQRFQRMQFHSGEHIVSGLAHQKWGCNNVGFHMNGEFVTLDFDRELDAAQLSELEAAANAVIWENRPVRTYFPSREELAQTDYRSKKEIAGQVRLAEFPGVDLCACCAPHVKATGEIGLIRLVDSMRHRGGIRITMLSGRLAWADAVKKAAAVDSLSRLLSAPRDGVVPAVERLSRELEEAKAALQRLEFQRLLKRAAELPDTEGNLCLFEEPGVNMTALRELVNVAVTKCTGMAAAFTGSDETGWKYIIGSKSVDLRAKGKAVNAAMVGRGGGSSEMIQGSASASRADIERYFAHG